MGRPNVGKSTFVNRLLGEERVIVSEVAGTTRDAIDLPLEVDGRRIVLVDTAGLRRQAKVSDSVEYYTTLRSQRAVERADVALVICDAHDGVTAQDLRIADLAMKEGCATALVLNKWDVAAMDEADLDHERAKVHQKLRLRPRVLTASALTGRNVHRVLPRRSPWATRSGPASRPRSSTASWPRRCRPASPRRSRGTACGSSTWRRSASARRGSRSGQQPLPRDPRLRLLRREPPARALRPRRGAARHRLQRAPGAAQPGTRRRRRVGRAETRRGETPESRSGRYAPSSS